MHPYRECRVEAAGNSGKDRAVVRAVGESAPEFTAQRHVVSEVSKKQNQLKVAQADALNPGMQQPLTLNERFSLISQQRRRQEAKSRQEGSRANAVQSARLVVAWSPS